MIFVLLNSAAAHGQTLQVGLPAFPPFAWQDKTGKTVGAVVELYAMLQEEISAELEIKLVPYARTLTYLRTGQLDMAILFRNQSVAEHVIYVKPVSLSKVIVLPTRGKAIANYRSLRGLKGIAVIRQAHYAPRFDRDHKLSKFPVESYEQGLKMMINNRIDAVAGSLSGLEDAIDRTGYPAEAFGAPLTLGHKAWWIHFSRESGYGEIIPALRAAAEKIYRPDLIYKLFLKQRNDRAGS